MLSRWVVAWGACFALTTGCVRARKVLILEEYVTPPSPQGQLVDVRFETGWRGEPPQTWAPRVATHDGRTFHVPATITSSGWLSVTPREEGVDLSVWVRRTGWNQGGFRQVKAVTGAIDRSVPNEVRFLPGRLTETLVLPMHQLHNVYNDFRFGDGDLLLVEAEAEGAATERYVFQSRTFGLRTHFGGGVLVRTPLPWTSEVQEAVTPAFALSAAFGYRWRSRAPFVTWLGRRLAVITSIGIGSTHIVLPGQSGSVEEDLRGVFNATLVGGGLQLYDFVSLQVLVNLTSLGRDASESTATLAVGFDAVQFGRFTADAGTRLFRRNTLDRRDRATR